ncbi:MAG: hypothetical protein IT372_29605 [Polyangiaceae bacterium]|nr:hypothetical protein [Polyangiaceae bacterium]
MSEYEGYLYPPLGAAPPDDGSARGAYYSAIDASVAIVVDPSAKRLDIWFDPGAASVTDRRGEALSPGVVYAPCAAQITFAEGDGVTCALTVEPVGRAQVWLSSILGVLAGDPTITFGALRVENLDASSVEQSLASALETVPDTLLTDVFSGAAVRTPEEAAALLVAGTEASPQVLQWPWPQGESSADPAAPPGPLPLGAGAAPPGGVAYPDAATHPERATWHLARITATDAAGAALDPATVLRALRDAGALTLSFDAPTPHPIDPALDALPSASGWEYLLDGVTYRIGGAGMDPARVEELQDHLLALQFLEVGASTGTYDVATALAVASFQSYARRTTDRYGLPDSPATGVTITYDGGDPPGRVGAATKEELRRWLLEGYTRPDQYFIGEQAKSDLSKGPRGTLVGRSADRASGEAIAPVVKGTVRHGVAKVRGGAGVRSVSDFLEAERATVYPLLASSAGAQADRALVLGAVLDVEGGLESLQTWDGNFLSVGPVQWNLGAGTGGGELPGLLHFLESDPAASASASGGGLPAYLGELALGTTGLYTDGNRVTAGSFTVDGTTVSQKADKDVFRRAFMIHAWAALRYARDGRFGGEAESLRALHTGYVLYANARVTGIGEILDRDRVYRLKDHIRTTLGVAIVLDMHINRPGYAAKKVWTAVKATADDLGISTRDYVTGWTLEREWAVLQKLFAARHDADIDMTDPDGRADAYLPSFPGFSHGGSTLSGSAAALVEFDWT